MDNTSTNPIDPEILKTYEYLLETMYANSGAIHELGRDVSKLHEKSRREVLSLLNLKNYKLLFTSGATEANNTAIKSLAYAYQDRGKHIITSSLEHPSVMNSILFLEKYMGYRVSILDVDENGSINMNDLKRELSEDTLLVSIMHVNNELGLIINQEWAAYVKEHSNAFTHSDMVQSLGNCNLDFSNIDMASFSAHKINGIKGSGFLVFRQHINLVPLMSGGDQEMGLRAGTENAPANIVLAKTVRLALERQDKKQEKLKVLSDYLYEKLSEIPGISINSNKDYSVYHIVNISAKGVGSEIMLNALGKSKIYVSAGSTCQSDIHKHSRVLEAMNISDENQATRIRISLNTSLSLADIDTLVNLLKEILENYAI